MKYLSLGDSIADGDEAFPVHLAKELPHLELVNLAQGGSRVPDLFADQLPAAVTALVRKDVKLITLVVGANDVLSAARERFENGVDAPDGLLKQIQIDVEFMKHNYDALLSILRTVGGPDVHIVMLTYYNPYPDDNFVMTDLANFALEDDQVGVNQAIRKLAVKYNAQVIDTSWPMLDLTNSTVIGDTTVAICDAEGKPLTEEDGTPVTVTYFDVHPNKHGHVNIANEIFANLESDTLGIVIAA